MKVVARPLEGPVVRLEPLAEGHRGALAEVAADPSFWTYSPVDADPARPAARWFPVWFDRARAAHDAGAAAVFAVRERASGRIVGTTRYLNLEPANRRVEIGATYYEPRARGSLVNPACKLLLLGEAFETFGAIRVELRCDARNLRSRRAIAALGAQQEGILRRLLVLGDGFVRDTVVFAILADEWPAVRDGLRRRLGDPAAPGVDAR